MAESLSLISFYSGESADSESVSRTPLPVRDWSTPKGYIADDDLVAAVNVAITVGRPLLVTGEPGTGKSELARSVAFKLGLGEPLKFVVKSDTESRDLFYTFDAVGRFHAPKELPLSVQPDASSVGGKGNNYGVTSFITYNALGEAILRANDPDSVRAYRRPGTSHASTTRSVVLIDEIDKAPRDVPNDILSEIDHLEFEVPELSYLSGRPIKITADKAFRPIVIITSNLEKSLPDAFLRRCVYYHLKFPSEDQLKKIVASHLGQRYTESSPFVDSALDFFLYLRQPQVRLNKPPATAELLDWLYVLLHSLAAGVPLPPHVTDHPKFTDCLSCALLKTQADQGRRDDLIDGWKKSPKPPG